MDIGPESEPQKTEIREIVEEGIVAVKSVEPEEVEKPLAPERSTDITAALSAIKDDIEIEIQESAETASPDIEVLVVENENIILPEDEVGTQEAREIVATELKLTRRGVLEEIEPQTAPEKNEQKEREDEIIELLDFIEPEELIEVEAAPASIISALPREMKLPTRI